MPTIKCLNERIERGEKVTCDSWLGELTPGVLEFLKNNPNEKAIYRCRYCPPNQRWIVIYYLNGLVWRALSSIENEQEDVKFNRIYNIEQIG